MTVTSEPKESERISFLRNGHGLQVDVEKIFKGSILLLEPLNSTNELTAWAEECLQAEFGASLILENNSEQAIRNFTLMAQAVKSKFTNHDLTKHVLEKILYVRYEQYLDHELLYDVPRLRIIPNSNLLKSGISYNYLPHRDTWYGGRQDQINHWLSVKNVSDKATFFIAPSFFSTSVENSSSDFDLETWDKVFRPSAIESVNTELRPHPKPAFEIPEQSKLGFDLASAHEVCFSGHHLHGSSQNLSGEIRISVDYRVCIPTLGFNPPENVDSSATGNYLNLMIKHPKFGTR